MSEGSTEKSNGSNGVLLQRAQAELSNFDSSIRTNGRFLFDSGSQRTYVKEEMRNKLLERRLLPQQKSKWSG